MSRASRASTLMAGSPALESPATSVLRRFLKSDESTHSESSLSSAARGWSVEGAAPNGPAACESLRRFQIIAKRFRILRFIDRGGMGEVYEAEDLALRSQPRIALKIIRPEISGKSTMIARFEREVEMSRMITHPNVCRTYDLGVHLAYDAMGNPLHLLFFTMELLRGVTLSTRLDSEGPFTTFRSLPLIHQIAEGLDAVHDAGIVHCDLKPGNIMLVPLESQAFPRVVLMDFGLAKRFSAKPSGNEPLDLTSSAEGTPDYMSPEQVTGKSLGPLSDIYAFGLLIYRMLTGLLAFPGRDPESRMRKRLHEAPALLMKHLPWIAPEWEKVISKCLSLEPQQRFNSAGDVVSALCLEEKWIRSLLEDSAPAGMP